jgi:hypothetical protein
MQRLASIVFGIAAVAIAVLLAGQTISNWKPWRAPSDAGDASDGALDGGAALATASDADLFDPDADLGNTMPIFPTNEPRRDGGIGFRMPDGSEVPPLPADAPLKVRFGVVLVSYAGAELASPTARSKHDAQELAASLAELAKTDFHAAVRKGDDGSADDVGKVPRGTLEPAPEFILFSLGVGKVADGPVDTPRGYWIVKRIE